MPHAGWGTVRFARDAICGHAPHYAKGLCRSCYRNTPEFTEKRRQYYEANKAQWARHQQKRKNGPRQKSLYGLEPERFLAMVEAQRGLCALCERAPGRKGLGVDHCHDTGQVRALLCARCNLGLGSLRDSADLCRRAARYLDYYHSLQASSTSAPTPRSA